MGINQVGPVTDTVAGEYKTARDNFVELSELDAAVLALQSAGMLGKAEKAERVVLVMRDALCSIASELVALREELDYIKRYGLGG